MSVIKVSEEDYEAEVAKSEKPVVIDFFATWCGPCKMLGPTIDELSDELSDKFKFCKIDIDESEELARKFEVRSVPTVVLVDKGNIEKGFVGVRSKGDIKEFLGV